jgi:crotonobetainyl-CoA:carnitine CoA-transferase CaiB-like acyl-CoA transferase
MAHEILEGYRVIDMTMFQLGPVNGMMLATMGAEVIKIEPPSGETGRVNGSIMTGGKGKGFDGMDLSAYYENNNRLKKSLVLDLNKPRAKEVFYKLVAKSDVLIQNMRYGVAKKLGAGYDDCKKVNPKLIYYNGTSFGTKGPDGTKPGMDPSGLARSGWMYMIPSKDGDPINGLRGCSDQIGAIVGCLTVISALLARERFGVGQECETSHLTASMWLMNCALQQMFYRTLDHQPAPETRDVASSMLSSYYKCADGQWIMLISPGSRTWGRDDPKYATNGARGRNAKEVISILDSYFIKKPLAEWAKIFEGTDVMWERVQHWEDLPGDIQVKSNNYMADYTHPLTGVTYKYQNLPMQFGETPAVKYGRAPLLGEHTAEILVKTLGYSPAELPKLLEEIGKPVKPAPIV